jgi:glyoxylase-like metal-dependent hydrolase (beta-lactamase superfamily II)
MTAVSPIATATNIPGLHVIALPTPFPIGPVNVYVDAHDPLTLIDCGIALDSSYDVLRAGLASLGHQIGDVRRLLISHHHTDHLGAAGRIMADVTAAGGTLEVIAHPLAVPIIETPELARNQSQAYASAFFQTNGVPIDVVNGLMGLESYLTMLIRPATVARTIDEGAKFHLAGIDWQVLHTPGHAGDHLCLFDPLSGALLSFDHILGISKSNPLFEPPDRPGDPRPQRLIDYERELIRLAALKPTIAYPGHGAPVHDVQTLVTDRIMMRERRTEKLFGLFDGRSATLYELTRYLFSRAAEVDYLMLSETQGHLDFLAQQGRIAPIVRADGINAWCLS